MSVTSEPFGQKTSFNLTEWVQFSASFALILLIAVVALFPGVNFAPVALFGASVGLFIKAIAPDFGPFSST